MPGKTITTMVTAIRTWANIDSVRLPDANALEIVNLVCRDLSAKYMSQHNLTSDSITLTPANRRVSLTATVVVNYPHRFFYRDTNGDDITLTEYPSIAELHAAHPLYEDAATYPEAYAFFGRDVEFAPGVLANVTIYRYYYAEPVEFTALDASSNGFLTYEWDLVLFRSLADYVSSFIIDAQRIPEWRAKADEIEDRFAARESARNLAGTRPVSEEP